MDTVPLKIDGTIAWAQHGAHLKAQVPVVSPEVAASLVLDLSVALVLPGKYTLQLRQPGGVILRRLDVRGSHTNKANSGSTAEWKHETHKHRYREVCGDAFAYTPDDIPDTTSPAHAPDPGEHGAVFEAFCRECGIDPMASWVDPPVGTAALQPVLSDWDDG